MVLFTYASSKAHISRKMHTCITGRSMQSDTLLVTAIFLYSEIIGIGHSASHSVGIFENHTYSLYVLRHLVESDCEFFLLVKFRKFSINYANQQLWWLSIFGWVHADRHQNIPVHLNFFEISKNSFDCGHHAKGF